jgi:dipeptidyl-peptidase-4
VTISPSPARTFPALDAATRHFSLGAPRTFRVAPTGARVYFLRTKSSSDRLLHLWAIELDAEGASERLIVDVAELLGDGTENIPEAERQRRERMREASSGITAYDLSADGSRVTFALSGGLYVVDLQDEAVVRRVGSDEGVIDPRIDPTGSRVAYVCGSELRVITIADETVTLVATAPAQGTVGLANFVAAEELDRSRGHWWSPDGQSLAFEEADNAALETIWIFDPIDPTSTPSSRQYPRAGTANPSLRLGIWHVAGNVVFANWDHQRYEYLVTVSWPSDEGPLVTLMTRDHRDQLVASITPSSGELRPHWSVRNEHFLEWTSGLPTVTPDGRLLVGFVDEENDAYRVAVVRDGVAVPFTPSTLQVMEVVGVTNDAILVVANSDPTTVVTARVSFDGAAEVAGSPASITAVVDGTPNGVKVSSLMDLDTVETTHVVVAPGYEPAVIPSFALTPLDATPPIAPKVRLLEVGEDRLSLAIVLPQNLSEHGKGLPILLCPYGGPHHTRVVGAGRAYALDQYLADQGFCVVIADGRGTGARGPAWDRSIVGVLGTLPVEDQVIAVEAVAAELGDLVDSSRVGIRGWSFGGYLAARCVLERPDVFHAAVAGAPVTDFGWYDTGYTERYLGHPAAATAAYHEADLTRFADRLERPLFFIHGFNDDNVLYAHTQLLSASLLAAGKSHRVLSLSDATHMPTDPVVAENMVKLQIDFFKETLGVA